MKRAVIYIRTSTEKQGKQASPEAQEKDAKSLIEANGWQLVGVYKDTERYKIGKKLVEPSGTRADRPALKQMITDGYNDNFDVIVAWKEDRLYRSYRPMLDVLDLLDKTDIDLVLVKEHFDKRLAPVKAWAAKMELDAKKDRTDMGVAAKLEKGNTVFFKSPYGYKKDDENNFIIDPDEAKWVKLIFELYADGTSVPDIRQVLVTGGAKQRREETNERSWLTAYIYRLLRLEYYWTGIYTVKWAGETYELSIPTIIPAKLAEQAKRRRGEYRNYPAGNMKVGAIAGGLCYCQSCNAKLQVYRSYTTTKGKKYLYENYHCLFSSRYREHKAGCCKQQTVKRLDAAIWEKVWNFVSKPAEFEAALQSRIESLQSQELAAEGELNKIQADLDGLLLERQKVIGWARKGIITESDLETQLLTLDLQEKTLKRDLNNARLLSGDHSAKLIELARQYRQQVEDGIEKINSMPDDPRKADLILKFRREIVQTIVTRVDVLPDKSPVIHLEVDFADQLNSAFHQSDPQTIGPRRSLVSPLLPPK